MTTIISWKTKDKVFIAADRQVTSGNIRLPINEPKIIQAGDKTLVAGTGGVGNLQQLMKIARKGLLISKIQANNEDLDIEPREYANQLAETSFELRLEFKRYDPFGFIVAGIEDEEPVCIAVEDDGSMVACNTFFADGCGRDLAFGLLEEHYNTELPEDQIAGRMIYILNQVMKRDIFTGVGIDMFVITEKEGIKAYDLADVKPPKEEEKQPDKTDVPTPTKE